MTHAICIKCGETKMGALVACPTCGFAPTTPSDQARSVYLSDQHVDRHTLDAIATKMRAGQQPDFDESAIQKTAAELAACQSHPRCSDGAGSIWLRIAVGFVAVGVTFVLIHYLHAHT